MERHPESRRRLPRRLSPDGAPVIYCTCSTRRPGHSKVRAGIVDVYDPAGHRVFRHLYALTRYKANITRILRPQVYLSGARAIGTYVVKIRILAASGGILSSNTHATTLKVHR